MFIFEGQLIDFSNTATVDLGGDGGIILIKFLTYTADELGGAFANSIV